MIIGLLESAMEVLAVGLTLSPMACCGQLALNALYVVMATASHNETAGPAPRWAKSRR